ncbi:MAG: rhodanese-like domain-containing protein [Myxococcus sp.]|nr:rhodanese-like domain-containing protein [Myxococcus sp.]
MKRVEGLLYVGAMALLFGVLFVEGRRSTSLDAREELTPKALYAVLSNPQVKVQLVDLRPYDDDHYLDVHVPGAVPWPECDPAKAPEAARERVYPYVTTVLITEDGKSPALEKCRETFRHARVLAGGMTAWSDALLPEDTGDYAPPKNAAGGGCL